MTKIILSILLISVSISCFVYTHFTAHQKGWILSNTYLWATKEEREHMDFKSEYKLITNVFRLVGIMFACLAAETLTSLAIFWLATIIVAVIAIIYVVMNTIKSNKNV